MRVESVLSRGLLSFVACGALVGPSSAWAQCEAGQLTSPDPEAQDGFAGVSLDGDVAVIGDRFAFDMLGAAYVYRRGPDGPADWRLEAVLTKLVTDISYLAFARLHRRAFRARV